MRPGVLFVVAGVWGGIFLGSMLAATGGHLSMPLDDSYIFFQYARSLVEGGFPAYQPGGGASTGATSPLTVLIHGAGYLFGFRGAAMPVFAVLVGAAALGWSAASAHTLGKRLCPQVSWLPPFLILLSGPLLWGFMSGMDLPVFAALALALAAWWPEPDRTPRLRFFIVGGLLGLCRPDAVFVLLPLIVFGWRFPGRKIFWSVPLAGLLLPFAVQFLVAGSPQTASLDAKSVLSDPGTSFPDWLLGGISFLQIVLKGVFGGGMITDAGAAQANDSSGVGFYMVPFSLALIILGLSPGAWHEIRTRRPGLHLLLATWVVLLIGAVSFAVPREWHWHRYLMPIYALAIPGIAAGAARAGHWIDAAWSEVPRYTGARALGGVLTLMSLPGAVFFTVAYGRNCSDIYFQHIELAGRFTHSRPVHPTVLGLHDAGALTYFGDYRVLDLEGLVSESFREPARLGGAGVWEAIEKLPPSERPDVLALYPNWFEPAFTAPHRLVHSQRLFRPSITAGNPLNVYLADWRLAGAGDRPRQPSLLEVVEELTLMAEVDIADLESEGRAGYRFGTLDGVYQNLLHHAESDHGRSLLDGGRLISGWEEFRVTDARPGDSLVLVARTHAPFRLRVEVNGAPAGKWIQSEGRSGHWAETSFSIPEEVVDAEEIQIRLFSDDPHHSAYGSFHYWVYRR